MLRQEATPEMVKKWKKIYDERRDTLTPNRKTGKEVEEYLRQHYSVTPVNTEDENQKVIYNIMHNRVFYEKLPKGVMPSPVTYYIQEHEAFVGIDLVSGYFCVEDSEKLYDELFAFRGLDEIDLENIFMVAEYINCTKE